MHSTIIFYKFGGVNSGCELHPGKKLKNFFIWSKKENEFPK